jgi:SAM-dependent methyltransferase
MIDEKYLNGSELYGDDFTLDEIEKWFSEETEGYSDLGHNTMEEETYHFHALNRIHGLRYIDHIPRFSNVLGFGSAWGHEFLPLQDRIEKLYIIEPSEKMRSPALGKLIPDYRKPNVSGKIDFPDKTFDLITCFGTLHHIPNVSFVLSELYRVLAPNGYLLLREPVISMGNWMMQRPGLTKNERGIPQKYLKKQLLALGFTIHKQSFCLTMTSFLVRIIPGFKVKPIFSYPLYIWIDKMLSKISWHNLHYHASRKIHRIAPESIFLILRKQH